MNRLTLVTFAALAVPALALPAMAQTPAAPIDEAAASRLLTDWGFTAIRLDDREGDHFEFEARDADGRDIDIEIGFDGTLRKFDVDDDSRASSVNLSDILPAEVQTVLADRGIVDVHEFDTSRRGYTVEGYNVDGREIEIEIARDNRVGTVSVGSDAPAAGPDLAAVSQAVSDAGYVTEGEPVARERYVEVLATNPEGEKVTLHTDFSGVVYRETLRR